MKAFFDAMKIAVLYISFSITVFAHQGLSAECVSMTCK